MKLLAENIEYIIIHSSHTRKPRANQGVSYLNLVHRRQGAFAWNPGDNVCTHHYVIRRDGVVEAGRKLDTPGNHTPGYNERSVSVCYMGGVDVNGQPADTRTPEQKVALKVLLKQIKEMFPQAKVVTHEQLLPRSAKGCPGFYFDQI